MAPPNYALSRWLGNSRQALSLETNKVHGRLIVGTRVWVSFVLGLSSEMVAWLAPLSWHRYVVIVAFDHFGFPQWVLPLHCARSITISCTNRASNHSPP